MTAQEIALRHGMTESHGKQLEVILAKASELVLEGLQPEQAFEAAVDYFNRFLSELYATRNSNSTERAKAFVTAVSEETYRKLTAA